MKNIGILAVAALLALVLGASVNFGTNTAQAEVDDTVAVGAEFLIGAIDGNPDDAASLADVGAAIDGISAAEVALLGDALGDEDGTLEASDLAEAGGWGANQLRDEGASISDEMYIFAFVDDDAVVTFDAETGASVVINLDTTGGPSANADGNVETCAAPDDLDCDTATQDDGDGVVVATVEETTADDDDTFDIDVSQADDASSVSTETFSVQGAADEVEVIAVETSIGTSADVDDCTEEADASDGTDQLGDLEKTVVIATVTDSDGDELTRASVIFTDDDDAVAIDESEGGPTLGPPVIDPAIEPGSDPSFDTGITVDAGDAGIAAFAVVCGDEDTGEGVITATINDGTAGEESADVTIQVVGEPANVALTASPAAIDCNGTASSTVTATVTDADGENVVNGTNVNFSVVALGIANPINAKTTDGVASSTITPLSGAVAGVTVLVTAGDAQASIRVDCNAAAATPTGPVATPTRGTGVVGPDTGNGGYLGQDSSAGFPAWTLIVLALGGVALLAGGMVTRKVTR